MRANVTIYVPVLRLPQSACRNASAFLPFTAARNFWDPPENRCHAHATSLPPRRTIEHASHQDTRLLHSGPAHHPCHHRHPAQMRTAEHIHPPLSPPARLGPVSLFFFGVDATFSAGARTDHSALGDRDPDKRDFGTGSYVRTQSRTIARAGLPHATALLPFRRGNAGNGAGETGGRNVSCKNLALWAVHMAMSGYSMTVGRRDPVPGRVGFAGRLRAKW